MPWPISTCGMISVTSPCRSILMKAFGAKVAVSAAARVARSGHRKAEAGRPWRPTSRGSPGATGWGTHRGLREDAKVRVPAFVEHGDQASAAARLIACRMRT